MNLPNWTEELVRGPNTSLQEASVAFETNARAALSEHTVKGYCEVVSAFDRWLGGGQLRDLTPDNVNRYVTTKRKTSPSMARLCAASLKGFAKWLNEYGMLTDAGKSVLQSVRIPRFDRERQPYTVEEAKQILLAISQFPIKYRARDRAAVLTALGTGLRLRELHELTVSNVHIVRPLEASFIVVKAETSKSGTDRQVRLPEESAKALYNYLHDFRHGQLVGPVFLTEEGKPFTYNGFTNYFAAIGDRLEERGIADFMTHRCRHFWATETHKQPENNVLNLAAEGGWKDLKTLRRYAKPSFEVIRRQPTAMSRWMAS